MEPSSSKPRRHEAADVTISPYDSTRVDNTMDEWQNGKSLVETNNYMLRYELACDVTLVVGEGQEEVRAHKYVLMSRSVVFLQAFQGYRGNKNVTIDIPDVTMDTMKDVLAYLYTEYVDLHDNNVTATLYAARKFAIKGLTAICFRYLDEEMSIGNVCRILEQAHIYNESNIHDKCHKFILLNAEEVLKTHGFFELCNECVLPLLKSDNLKAEEDQIMEAMLLWATNECRRRKMAASDENRRKALGPLLYHIRFPTMDVVYFTQKISFRDILSNDEAVSIFQYFHGEKSKLDSRFNTNERNRLRPKKAQPVKKKQTHERERQKNQKEHRVRIVTPPKRFIETPIVVAAPMSPNMSTVTRFRTYDGQWKQNGPPDAISFSCSTPIVLYGVQVYGPARATETYGLKIFLYDDLKEEVRKNDATITTDIFRKTYDVMFARPIRIPARRIFTVVVALKGSPVVKGVDGSIVHVVDGVTFEFTNSNRSSNGTDITIGQIPSLLFNKTE